MASTKFCQGISDISDTYMGFIVDQWGVLHDGTKLYDGVTECLEQLNKRHKTIIILSNSTVRAEPLKQALEKMGLPRDQYHEVVSSGEIIARGLKSQNEGIFKNIGKRCYLFGRKQAADMFEGTDVEIVDDIAHADFILIAGIDKPMTLDDDPSPVLKEAVRRGLKAICANPDSHALLGANYLMGPGLIARKYQEYGGVVHHVGKPHGPIFRDCIKIMQEQNVYPAQTVMVGDTMAHDIMGAYYAHLDTCLVKTGMHAGVFKNCATPADVDRTLDVLISHYNNVRPRYLVNRFEWGQALPDRKHKVHKKHERRKPAADAETGAGETSEDSKSERPKIKKRPTPRKPKSSKS